MATNATNIVLVHGLWADGSSWSKVIPILKDAGHRIIAVQLPLHSLADDVATVNVQ
jgi:pimeloyl-ACP methyl ester carboxylesterase